MDSSIRTRLSRHTVAAQALFFRTIAGGVFEMMPNWARGYSGLLNPIFNIFLPRRPTGLSDDNLADTAAFFSSRNAFYSIEIIHDLIPHGPDFLNQRHYQPLPPQPAMVFADSSPSLPRNPEVTVDKVTNVPTLTAFCSLQNAIFDFSLQDMRQRFTVAQIKDDQIAHYLAFKDDQPVGAGTIVYAEGVASLWNIGTLDQYRQQGVATTLLRRMLGDASQHACDMVLLFSTAQAFRFFSQWGFEIFTQRQWFLPPGIDYGDEEDDGS